jgi:predicted dehydrogenase
MAVRNVTVIGCGAVVQALYKTPLQRLEREGALIVKRVVDRDLNRAREAAGMFRNASACDDVASGVQGADLTIVATPATLHHDHAIAALTGGSHVLCEKPMAVTADQCREMNQVARSKNLKLSVGMIRRYYPALVQAKRVIDSGAIGRVTSFTCREGRQYNWPIATVDSFQKGGHGILLDIGSHVLDILIWLFGTPRIVAHRDDGMCNGIEASCVTELAFGGITGSVHLSWDYDLVNRLEIVGTAGRINVSLDGIDSMAAWREDGSALSVPDEPFQLLLEGSKCKTIRPQTIQDLVYLHLCRFLASIDKDEKPGIDGEDGLAVISAIESCYRMAGPLDMNWLPPAQNDSFKKLHWRQTS